MYNCTINIKKRNEFAHSVSKDQQTNEYISRIRVAKKYIFFTSIVKYLSLSY